MQNLKIRVNSADESKEVQELFFKLGGSWAGYKNIQTWSDIGHLYLENDCIRFGGDSEYFEKCTGLKEITLLELRAMVSQEQDEPFLTPETTLNDQYAEIEEVRQQTIESTLSQRQTKYGCYEDVAQVTQQILSALRIGNYDKLPAPMKESLHMIASKMARIVNGDPEYFDNWHDIGGYAKLIEKLIKGE